MSFGFATVASPGCVTFLRRAGSALRHDEMKPAGRANYSQGFGFDNLLK